MKPLHLQVNQKSDYDDMIPYLSSLKFLYTKLTTKDPVQIHIDVHFHTLFDRDHTHLLCINTIQVSRQG